IQVLNPVVLNLASPDVFGLQLPEIPRAGKLVEISGSCRLKHLGTHRLRITVTYQILNYYVALLHIELLFLSNLLYNNPWEKEEQAAAEKAVTKEEFQGEWTAPAPEFTAPPQPEVADWSEGVQVPSVPIQPFPAEDWSAQPATEDWSAAPTAQATEWVGTTTEWS
uniref:Small ribosomal subunit protein uS2 C-terminal domain-containing protein n=1 Tax=Anolis carolinensis TaxID=28377 RepID=A0A803TB42_ANOCA